MGMDSVFKVSLVLDMIDNMTGKVNGVSDTVQSSFGGMTNAFDNIQRAGLAMTGVGTAITGAALGTVTATFDTQNALGELASLGVEDLQAVEKAAKGFSDTWAGTTKADFITAAYDIKSGIASLTDEGIAQFTELAALTGKATKSTTEEMGSLFATGYGIYKDYYGEMSDLEFGEMFSAGIATAVKNYKTSGSQMADAIGKLGATATNANVPMEEQLAILGQLQTTMSGSEAATKYNAFLQSAAKAGDKLGLTFTDTNNQLLSTPEILDKLKSKYGETLDAVEKQELKDAFGTDEAIKYIDLLYGKTDDLRGGIEDLHDSMEDGISVTEGMAEAINGTPEQKFEVLKQKVHNAVEELGSGLLPSVNNAMDAIGNLIQKGSDWISNNQETVSSIMNIIMYLGIFLIAAGALTTTIGTVGKTLSSLTGIFRGVKTAMSGAGFLSALAPIAVVAAAVIGLIAVFEACGGDVSQLQGMISNAFASVGGIVSRALNAAAAYLPGFLAFGGQLLMSIANGIASQLPTLLIRGAQMILSISSGIAAQLPSISQKATELITGFVSTIVSGLPGLLSAGAGLILSILQGIGMLLPSVTQMATQLILGFLGAIVSGLPGLLSAGSGMITSILSGITQLLPVILQSGVMMVTNLVSGILQMLPTLIQSGVSFVVSVGQGILQMLPVLIQSGIAMVLQLLSGIAQNLPNLLSAGGQMVMSVLSGIAQLLPGILSGGLAIVGNIVSGIFQGIPSLVSIGGDIVNAVWSAITETDWLAIGGEMVSGITDGFMSGFESLVSTVKGAWDSFVGWFTGSGDEAEAPELPEPTVNTPTVTTAAPVTASVAAPTLEPQTQTVTQTVQTEITPFSMPEMPDVGMTTIPVTPEFDTSLFAQAGTDGMAAFQTGLDSGMGGTQESADALMSYLQESLSGSGTNLEGAGSDLIASITDGMEAQAGSAQLAAGSTMEEILASVGSVDTSQASNIGSDIMSSIGDAISENAEPTAAAAQETINAAMSSLQSVDIGATDTLGSEIMNGIGDGITANGGTATNAAQEASGNITDAFNVDASGLTDGVTGAAETITSTVSGLSSSVTSEMESCWNSVKSSTTSTMSAITSATQSGISTIRSAWSSGMSSINSAVSSGMASVRSTAVGQANSIASQIRSAFSNIHVTVPAPRLPHISVSYSTVGSGNASAQVPNFSVAYYAKGGIMTKPTTFAYDLAGGQKLVGGEAGAEAILPLDTLWTKMREVVTNVIGSGNKEKDTKESIGNAQGRIRNLISERAGALKGKNETKTKTETGGGKKYYIEKFIVNADMSDIDSIGKLKRLLDELDSPDGSLVTR